MSLHVQALWFRADRYTKSEAKEWCDSHDFKSNEIVEREDDGLITHWISRQFPTNDAIDGTWKTLSETFPEGISASACERRSMSESKAYSTFQIKSYDEEMRVIRGIASTPETDREGDQVIPKGARFQLPVPLLAQHDHNQPVGMVTSAEVSDKGIEIEATIAKDSQLSYVERTWRQVKAGLLRGFSIGFRADKYEPISTGKKWLSYEIFEISLVTIPANAGAGISSVKKYDDSDIDLDEQLLEAEAEKTDAINRAAAAIEKANHLIETK